MSNISRTTSATKTTATKSVTGTETAVWKCEKLVDRILIIDLKCKFPTDCKQYLYRWYLVFELANHDSAFPLSLSLYLSLALSSSKS